MSVCVSAEKAGFEPAVHFWRTHAFQACLFNHSSISPKLLFQKRAQITKKNPLKRYDSGKMITVDSN